MSDLPTKPAAARPPSPQIAEFLKRQTQRARISFIVDATASRQDTWDMATKLMGEMFDEVSKLGGLEVQIIYYRGHDECKQSPWMSKGRALANLMSKVSCRAGGTQIERALKVVREEHQRQKISACVFVGDTVEENSDELCDAVVALGVPFFVFHEGDEEVAGKTLTHMARLTKEGAYCKFDSGSAKQLSELLRAVATFASGGREALASLNSTAARLMLGQMK